MLSIEVGSLGGADEELGAVRIGAGVGHGEATRAEVLSSLACKGLIGELGTVDRLAASSISCGKVSTLAHESGNDAVEARTSVTEALLVRAKSAEVFGGAGTLISEEFKNNAAGWAVANADIEVHLGIGRNRRMEGLVRHCVEDGC